jgi:SgrR family transcriptional regulator
MLEAFVPYFQGRAHLDRIEIWVVPDIRVHSLLDQPGTEHLHFHPFRKLAKPTSLWKGIDKLETGCKYITFNLNRPGPHQRISFRQAFHLLLDRERMIRELGANRLFPAAGFWPEERMVKPQPQPEEAGRLLMESGYRGRGACPVHLRGRRQRGGLRMGAAVYEGGRDSSGGSRPAH